MKKTLIDIYANPLISFLQLSGEKEQ